MTRSYTAAPLPANEAERLAALQRHALLDTPPEAPLDAMVSMLAEALDVPIALISLVDRERQWFKARIGLMATETPRDVSFCAHAVAADAPLVVPDTHQDPRFAGNPLVVEDPSIRFYAGYPLRTAEGFVLGTLCAIDRVPRDLSPMQRQGLEALAGIVQEHLRLRYREQAAGTLSELRSFVGMAVHDLKNPLFAVLGLAALVKDRPEVLLRKPELLEDLFDSANVLNRRLTSMLDLVAQLDGEGMKLDRVAMSPEQLVSGVVRRNQRLMQDAGVALEMRISPQTGTLYADPSLMERLLENLIGNAVRHAGRNGRIAVEVQPAEQGGTLLVVTDNGPGVPPEQRESVFAPYRRGQSDGTRGSLGLGLAFCKAATERHGGRIWVEDAVPGPGARICVYLPGPVSDAD